MQGWRSMVRTPTSVGCQPAACNPQPAPLVPVARRQNARLAAARLPASKRAEMETEIERLRSALELSDSKAAAGAAALSALDRALTLSQRANHEQRDRTAEIERRADKEARSLRTELAAARGKLNMRGAVESVENQFKATLVPGVADKLNDTQLWRRLLVEEGALASCFEELGWTQEAAPGHMAQMRALLSKHAYNEFQLSQLHMDIVVGVVDEEQARALACICSHLGLDWQISTLWDGDGSSSDGSGEDE